MAVSPRKRLSVSGGNVQDFRSALAQFPAKLTGLVKFELINELTKLKSEMLVRSSNPPGPLPAGGGVHQQTGRLMRSWAVESQGATLANLTAAVGSFARGKAPLLERGGKVYAPKGTGPTSGWIFIPADPNRFPSGMAIFTPKQVLDSGGYFVDRRKTDYQITNEEGKVTGSTVPPAIIEGQVSFAWKLLVDPVLGAMFIMAKNATYRPQLGFLFAAKPYEEKLPPLFAERVIEYWKTVPL